MFAYGIRTYCGDTESLTFKGLPSAANMGIMHVIMLTRYVVIANQRFIYKDAFDAQCATVFRSAMKTSSYEKTRLSLSVCIREKVHAAKV